MADMIAELGNSIKSETKSGIRAKNINKEDFKENLQLLITRFSTFLNTIGAVSTEDRKRWADKIFEISNDRNAQFCKVYVEIGKALQENDLRVAFASFYFAADKYKAMLTAMDKTLNEMFKEKVITVYNSKLSTVATFGLLKQASVICNVAHYLVDGINQEICQHNGVRELEPPKKYRFAYVDRHLEETIDILKQMLGGNGAYAFATGVTGLKNSKDDVVLVDDENNANLAFITPHSLNNSTSNLLKYGVRQFGVFRWLGEQWNLFKHAKYLKATKEKEWMSTHVELLRLSLSDADKDSPEYQKQVKIINAYNDMLAKLDQKIDEYEND